MHLGRTMKLNVRVLTLFRLGFLGLLDAGGGHIVPPHDNF